MDRIKASEGGRQIDGNLQFVDDIPGPDGQMPSRITARIMNLLTNELANLVEDSGQTLNEEDHRQVAKAIFSLSTFPTYDIVVSDLRRPGHYPTLSEALSQSKEGSRILIAKNLSLDSTIELNKNAISISTLPNVEVVGNFSGSVFKIIGRRISIKDINIGFKNLSFQDRTIIEMTATGESLILTRMRIFGQRIFTKVDSTSPRITQSAIVLDG